MSYAGHWFKLAVIDILEYRGESSEAGLRVALPYIPRHQNWVNLRRCYGKSSSTKLQTKNKTISFLERNMAWQNKSLRWTPIQLRFIAADELGR